MLKGKKILTEIQKEVLNIITGIKDLTSFYLSGGTALSEFYFGHRKSYDLDIFTGQKGLVIPVSRIAEDMLKESLFDITTVRRFESFAEFEVSYKKEILRLHFALDSPFRFEQSYQSDLNIKVNGYKDIIADKLLAFFGRVEPRDAVDLFFILEKENFWYLTELTAKKDPGFDLYWMAVALERVKIFPDSLNRWPVDMLLPLDIAALKNRFSGLALEIMEKLDK
ncbi:MAG: nucleotidyl transferase AbiEii/AbiGii toxin family protein [Actinobacteria bacterium]|nr:nucleotidyl transferase AbiEii/AbiGii toxin family protein [Actinomycetota bacterium]MBM3712363.1 nucleotidyl transferase AbiEii/AbiGii toxin family protein [Actinomycetota bacterium]